MEFPHIPFGKTGWLQSWFLGVVLKGKEERFGDVHLPGQAGTGERWSERVSKASHLCSCSGEQNCGQTWGQHCWDSWPYIQKSETRTGLLADGQLPPKLVWESSVAESLLDSLALNLSPSSLCPGSPVGLPAVIILKVGNLSFYGGYEKWVNDRCLTWTILPYPPKWRWPFP